MPNIFKGKDKWYCKKENVPKPYQQLTYNKKLKKIKVKCNSEIISLLHLKEPFTNYGSINYLDIKELTNRNFLILFTNKFYYINSMSFKILNIDESLKKCFCQEIKFSYFEEINIELIGVISNNIVLIVQINKKEAKLFQEIKIKANILKSFPNENLLIINEYIDEEEKKLNILNYYIYDKNLKYQFIQKEEINFAKISIIDNFDLFNCIKNIKKLKNGKMLLFTVNTIPFKEKQEFDNLNRSFYERDVELYLNIYLYKNKKLTLIYKKIYKMHFVYNNSIYESEYADFLKIFNDENLLINEKDGLISFFNANLSNYVTVNIEEKKGRKIVLEVEGFNQCIFDRKSKCCYLVRSFEDLEEQTIVLYLITEKNLIF